MPADEVEDFISDFLTELHGDNAAAFVGAGLSKAAGYVDWGGLLQKPAKAIGLNSALETDLVGLAQFYVNANGSNRGQLNQLLIDRFSDLVAPSENHRILARLPIRTFWTTNYDKLIESALEANGKRIDVKYSVDQLATTQRGRDALLYKMHGDIDHPAQAILIRDDYEKYHLSHAPFVTALSGDLVSKTFVFLGFSFTDPNLEYVFSRVRIDFAQDQRQHFCITKRRTKNARETEEDFIYARTRQSLVAGDLMRFNVKTVFINEFAELTEILGAIERRYRAKTVFIAGSAAEYGPWGADISLDFLTRLSAELIGKEMRIATGFGYGVGGAIVTGAVQAIYSTPFKSVDQQLVMRPFPISISDPARQRATFERYREELLSQAGIALFLFGNKTDPAGHNVPADGLKKEFEMARQRGLFVVPVGASGFVAKELWNTVMADFESYFPGKAQLRPHMEALGKEVASPIELLSPLLSLIEELSKG